ncbi:LacI family DNA-binding transcriptional regulator [Microbacterium awajiense]
MAGPVGIRTVAAQAGVSVGTVSNVINKPETVSARTLAHVQQVMDELGFVRNDLARQLKMGGGTTLGLIVLNVANPFFAGLAHACEAAAEELGYTVIMGSSDQLREREDRYIDLFEQQRVRGMLIAGLDGATERIQRLTKRGMPLVLFDIHAQAGEFCTVALDGAEGGYMAVSHLIETGRRRIAFVGGPLSQVDDRWQGASRAADGIAELTHIDTPDQTIADGRAIGEQIIAMSADQRPDGIFAANDTLGLGVLQALVLADDIVVPRDIALVGYDDIEYSRSAIVPMSSVRQPVDTLAREAVRLVLEHAGDPSAHEHRRVLLRPELVARRSSVR